MYLYATHVTSEGWKEKVLKKFWLTYEKDIIHVI